MSQENYTAGESLVISQPNGRFDECTLLGIKNASREEKVKAFREINVQICQRLFENANPDHVEMARLDILADAVIGNCNLAALQA